MVSEDRVVLVPRVPVQGVDQFTADDRIGGGPGEILEHLQPTRKGDPDAPLSDAELEQKYMELASPVIGEERARALLARLWHLESEAVVAAINE